MFTRGVRLPLRSSSLCAALAGALALPLGAAGNGTTERASLSSTGQQGNGLSYYGGGPSDRYTSADGRIVAFQSESNNLVAGDTNGQTDVFVRDMLLGTTVRASVSTGGAQGDGASSLPSVSADGRFVAFQSDATNLAAGDVNVLGDVFVRDLAAGTTELVSRSSSGSQGNGASARPSIDATGRFVAFQSTATNWIPGKTVALTDIFVRDRLALTTEWVNPPQSSAYNSHHSGNASISDDGRFVAFESLAGDIAPTSFNVLYTSQIYVRDRLAGSSEWISVCTPVSGESSDSFQASISGDGRCVAYESNSTTAVPNDTNGMRDIFVRDRLSGTTERANVSSTGAQAVTVGPSGSTGSKHASISRTGRFVSFSSFATNLDPADALPFNFEDVFRRDRQTGTTTIESLSSGGAQGNSSSQNATISADGLVIAFISFATNLVPGDTNFTTDVFVRSPPNPYALSYCTAGTSTNGCVASIDASGTPSVADPSGFAIRVSNVEGAKQGLLFYGISGRANSPWAAGSTSFLCVKSPTQRLGLLGSGGTSGQCDGAFSADWLAFVAASPSALGAPFLAGSTLDAQAWYRDPPAAKTTSLSDALEFVTVP